MKESKNIFTVSVYTENNIGLLNRISAIFLKRHINIDSLTTSQSEIKDIFRFVIVVNASEFMIKRLVKQIEKQIEVIASFYHTDDQTIFLEKTIVSLSSLFNISIVWSAANDDVEKNTVAKIIKVFNILFLILFMSLYKP